MAGETLRTVDQMLADWADNNQGLITAVKGRDMIVTEAVNVGFLQLDNGPVAVPIVTTGVLVNINTLITPATTAANFWQFDGNNGFQESYTAQGITVPPGVQRLTTFGVTMVVARVGGGTGSYEFQFFADGVSITPTGYVAALSATPAYVRFESTQLIDYSLAETFDVRVANLSDTQDLSITEFGMQAMGVPV